MKALRLLLITALSCALAGKAAAQVPQIVNYQGRVAVDAVNFEGSGLFKFALVNSDGSATFWSNDETSVAGSEPTDAVTLPVSKGLYSVLLGDTALTNMLGIPATVFANPDVRLRVWFDDGVNASQLLMPDQRLAPSTYLADGSVMSPAIATGAVTGTHVAPASLDFSHLTVPAAPAAGQVLGFDGASFVWQTGTGESVFSLNGTSAFYLGGNVGIRTNTPAHSLSIAGGPAWTSNLWSGAIELTNASAIGWQANAAGSRFGIGQTNSGLYFFRTTSDPGTTGSQAIYDMFINDGGNVVMTGGGPGFFTVGSPNGETGHSLQRNGNRADLRFDGSTIKLVAAGPGGPPPSTFGIAVNTAGNVGIGTTTPGNKLHVAGGLTYDGLQSKLDVADAFAATVRAADVFVGHPSRRGLPGRALVDLGTSLVVNFASDWGATIIGGAVTEVRTLRITGGADLAEPFAMSERDVPPGAVVVIDAANPGKLRMSGGAYDKKVAGIVSGADGIRPGISMIQEDALEAGENVALSGRVYVKANTSAGAIEPGDLLTTSDIPGEAMRAADHARAQGAILGKAMTRLAEGTGSVLVLVTLQ